MDQVDVEGLKEVLPFIRRSYLRLLAKRSFSGERVAADDSSGLPELWVHRADAAISSKRPLVIELHGGGFALGDARKSDAAREWIKDSFDVNVVGVNYRLAPEHPFPSALQDIVNAVRYCSEHAGDFGVDREKVVLLGFSAGANLALAASFALTEEHGDFETPVHPSALVLHYPFLDAFSQPKKSGRDLDLPYSLMVAFNQWYAAGADTRNPLLSPAFAGEEQLAALPPVVAYPVSGDALEQSCIDFCNRLQSAGGDVRMHTVAGQYHGYIEDAVDLPSYLAQTMPDIIRARPHDFVEAAWDNLRSSLSEVLGAPARAIPRPAEGYEELLGIFQGDGARRRD